MSAIPAHFRKRAFWRWDYGGHLPLTTMRALPAVMCSLLLLTLTMSGCLSAPSGSASVDDSEVPAEEDDLPRISPTEITPASCMRRETGAGSPMFLRIWTPRRMSPSSLTCTASARPRWNSETSRRLTTSLTKRGPSLSILTVWATTTNLTDAPIRLGMRVGAALNPPPKAWTTWVLSRRWSTSSLTFIPWTNTASTPPAGPTAAP